jgi:hypothetical protein
MVHAIALSVVLQLSNAAGVSPPIAAKAQAEVVRVYREIGVDVEWSRTIALGGDRPLAIHVILIPYETGNLQQRPKTVMGAAIRTPNGTKVAYVFYRRVESEAAQHAVSAAFVLACAIAHEVGHLLMPDGMQSGHTSMGLMRASWDRDDFRRADMGQLRFQPEQALLIRARLQTTVEEQRGDNARQ